MMRGSDVSRSLKRAVDLLGAGLGLAILSGPMLVVAGAVRLTMGKPVLFRQTRPGLGAKPFAITKFRTMKDATGPNGTPLADEARLTPLGRWMRRTSIDELPELINVLKGDMSLVGPRPLCTKYLPYYTEAEQRRHSVRPGITGLAQIAGRNHVRWDERLALDVQYVDNWSLGLDFEILLKTLGLVLGRDGVVDAPGTMMQDLDVERSSCGRKAGEP